MEAEQVGALADDHTENIVMVGSILKVVAVGLVLVEEVVVGMMILVVGVADTDIVVEVVAEGQSVGHAEDNFVRNSAGQELGCNFGGM